MPSLSIGNGNGHGNGNKKMINIEMIAIMKFVLVSDLRNFVCHGVVHAEFISKEHIDADTDRKRQQYYS